MNSDVTLHVIHPSARVGISQVVPILELCIRNERKTYPLCLDHTPVALVKKNTHWDSPDSGKPQQHTKVYHC